MERAPPNGPPLGVLHERNNNVISSNYDFLGNSKLTKSNKGLSSENFENLFNKENNADTLEDPNLNKQKYDRKAKIIKEEYEKKLSELDNVMLIQEKEIEKQRNRILELEERLKNVEYLEDFQKTLELSNCNNDSKELDSDRLSILSPLNQFGDKLTERLANIENEKKKFDCKWNEFESEKLQLEKERIEFESERAEFNEFESEKYQLEKDRIDFEAEKENFEWQKSDFEEMRGNLSDEYRNLALEKSFVAKEQHEWVNEKSGFMRKFDICNKTNILDEQSMLGQNADIDAADQSDLIFQKRHFQEMQDEIAREKTETLKLQDSLERWELRLKSDSANLKSDWAALELQKSNLGDDEAGLSLEKRELECFILKTEKDILQKKTSAEADLTEIKTRIERDVFTLKENSESELQELTQIKVKIDREIEHKRTQAELELKRIREDAKKEKLELEELREKTELRLKDERLRLEQVAADERNAADEEKRELEDHRQRTEKKLDAERSNLDRTQRQLDLELKI